MSIDVVGSENNENTPFGPEGKPWIETLSEVARLHGCVSPPVGRPGKHYEVPLNKGVGEFQVPSTGLTPAQRATALDDIREHRQEREKNFLGFQANQDFPHLKGLEEYLQCQFNNLGDPFVEGSFTLNTKWLERSVLDYFASLWNARWPHDPRDPESYWGYVLSMGSTEGNLYGLWNAREYLSGGALLADPEAEERAKKASEKDSLLHRVQHRLTYSQPQINGSYEGDLEEGTDPRSNAYRPLVFYSDETHYSIQKAVRALKLKTFTEVGRRFYPAECPLAGALTWPDAVPSLHGKEGPGIVDIDALAQLVDFFAKKGYPILVFLNYGTTFKGGYDDVQAVGEALIPILKKHGLYEREVRPQWSRHSETRHGFWIHVDGALGAAYMPFVEMAKNAGRFPETEPVPLFDFRLPFVHSIVMSGHKWIGAPWPCGIYMTKTKLQLKPPSRPEYVGTPDTTFAGSRNGFSSLLLWNFIAMGSYDRQIDLVVRSEELAAYLHFRLIELQRKLAKPLWVERSPYALTVRFKAPTKDIQARFSLASETLFVNDRRREYSHLFLMPHVTREQLDALLADLGVPGAFPEQEGLPRKVDNDGLEIELAALVRERLKLLRDVIGSDVWIDSKSATVHFRSPSRRIVERFSLDVEIAYVEGRRYRVSRINNISALAEEVLEDLLRDLGSPGAFGDEEAEEEPGFVEEAVSKKTKGFLHFAHSGLGFK